MATSEQTKNRFKLKCALSEFKSLENRLLVAQQRRQQWVVGWTTFKFSENFCCANLTKYFSIELLSIVLFTFGTKYFISECLWLYSLLWCKNQNNNSMLKATIIDNKIIWLLLPFHMMNDILSTFHCFWAIPCDRMSQL